MNHPINIGIWKVENNERGNFAGVSLKVVIRLSGVLLINCTAKSSQNTWLIHLFFCNESLTKFFQNWTWTFVPVSQCRMSQVGYSPAPVTCTLTSFFLSFNLPPRTQQKNRFFIFLPFINNKQTRHEREKNINKKFHLHVMVDDECHLCRNFFGNFFYGEIRKVRNGRWKVIRRCATMCS